VDESVRWAELVFDQQRGGDDPAATASAAALLADMLIAGWRPEEAGPILEPVVAELPSHDEEPYVEAVAQLARVRMMTGASVEGAELADSVLGAAERLEDPRLLVELLNTRGTCLANLGRLQESRVLIAGAVELAREHGMGDALLRAHNNLNYVLAFIDPTQGLPAVTEALADTIRLGHQGWETRFRLVLGWLLEAEGDYEKAKAMRDEGRLAEMGSFEEQWYRISDLNMQTIQGDPDAGRDCIELLAEFAASSDRQLTTLAHHYRAQLYLLLGQPERALQDLRVVKDNTGYQQTLLLLYASCAFVLRDVEVARGAVALREVAYPSRWGRTMTATSEAVLAALEGRPGDASAHFERALSLGVSPPNWHALIQAMYGALLADESAQARVAGEAAYRWFLDTGSYGYLALFPEIVPADDGIARTS
jgi:tetratricopeptide (TPR) repeat protein